MASGRQEPAIGQAWRCKQCSFESARRPKFCPECGTKCLVEELPLCVICGENVPSPDMKICQWCASLTQPVQEGIERAKGIDSEGASSPPAQPVGQHSQAPHQPVPPTLQGFVPTFTPDQLNAYWLQQGFPQQLLHLHSVWQQQQAAGFTSPPFSQEPQDWQQGPPYGPQGQQGMLPSLPLPLQPVPANQIQPQAVPADKPLTQPPPMPATWPSPVPVTQPSPMRATQPPPVHATHPRSVGRIESGGQLQSTNRHPLAANEGPAGKPQPTNVEPVQQKQTEAATIGGGTATTDHHSPNGLTTDKHPWPDAPASANKNNNAARKKNESQLAHGHNLRSTGSTIGVLEARDHQRCVAIRFHIIVPLQHWLWNKEDKDNRVSLRFGHPKLGNWNEDVGKFKLVKDLDKHYWMRCTLHIDIEIVRFGNPIPYKYVVYSPNRKDASQFEYFHDSPNRLLTNRCLAVPLEDCKPKGTCAQFDGMVFPEEQPASLRKRFTNLFWRSSEVEQLKPLSFTISQEMSLGIFLEEHFELLRSLDSPNTSKVSNLEKFANSVYRKYQQLRLRKIFAKNVQADDWVALTIPKVFKGHLMETAYHLNKLVIESSAANGKRMSLVLIILDLLFKISDHLQEKDLESAEINILFSMLMLRPDLSKAKKFPDLNDVVNFIPQNYRKHIATVLAHFINQLLPSNHLECTNWVFVMPLMHELGGKLDKATTSDVVKWKDDRVNLLKMGKPKDNATFKIIKELQEGDAPFLALDPLLLPLLVDRCPSDELPAVVSMIPPYISAAIILKLINAKKGVAAKFDVPEVNKLIPLIKSFTDAIKNVKRCDEIETLFFEVMEIFDQAVKKLYAFTELSTSLLHNLLTLLLQTASMFEECSSCTDPKKSAWISECLDKLWTEVSVLLLNEWIVKYCTPVFGGTNLRDSDKDIKMFEELIGIYCPSNVQARWHAVLKNTLKERVERILPNHQKLDLLDVLEKKDHHHLVINVFMDAVTQSFEKDYNTTHVQNLFQKSKGKYRDIVGRVLDRIFMKEYPKEVFKVSIKCLLTWDMWPISIKIYKSELMIEGGGKVSSAQSSLSERCSLMCSLADSSLSLMMTEIFDSSVTFRDMEFILKKQVEVERLCAVSEDYKLKEVRVILKRRKLECTAFRDYKTRLDSFCSKLDVSKVQITGLPHLLTEIKQDHFDSPIKTLCCVQGPLQDVQYLCFKAAQPLQQILTAFHNLSILYPSELFQQVWKSKLREVASAKLTLTFKDVVVKIWTPVFEECCQLIDSVKSLTITLAAVNHHFHHFDQRQSHLELLFKATEACFGRQVESTTWIRIAIERMHLYWSLREQANAARTVMELKESLKLKGNFEVIEGVASAFTASMDKRTLNDIDQRLIDMSSFLEHFTKDRKKLECLRSFAACLDLVEWIRKESQDVNDLHKFVTIALHTSVEEGDLSSDKLSHLKVVGSGFGPLIYGLKSDPSFESFQHGCHAVWEAIDEAKNLPKLLIACNDDLEWYKSVKETQASFEVTSFGQMDNIFQYGCYIVGSAKSHICQHYHEVIRLTLKAKDKPLTKTNYNLEELRDLESKLVLITGSKAENRAKVDVFIDTLHSICRIAEVLLTLQQVGNVNYTGWVLQVRCSTDRQLIDQLQSQASNMEDELSQWEEDVKSQRDSFYELNYYTTLQLLSLRRELGRLKDTSKAVFISPEVLALLRSISTQVGPTHVINAVNQVLLEAKVEPKPESVPTMEPPSDSPADEVEEKEAGDAVEAEHEPDDMDLPEPAETASTEQVKMFSEDDLTEEQKGYITTISFRVDCSRKLVLKAFEVLGNGLTHIDYQKWCAEKMDDYTFDDEEVSSDEESESDSDSTDSASSDGEFSYATDSTQMKSSSMKKKPVLRIIKIERIAKELVDENHPAVIELVEKAGYGEKQSVDAIAKYGTVEAAMDHMADTSDEEDDEEPDLIPSAMRQFSREDSLPDFELNWDHDSGLSIYYLPEAEEKYLKLEYLGRVLKSLTCLPGTVQHQRTFPTEVLKEGYPNLLVEPPENILRTVLSLYMLNHEDQPLPTPEEVLVCYPSTTAEEIELFWRRAISDPEYKRIFCLVHAEKLTYQVSDQALSSLSNLSQAQQNYRLVIVCSNEEESMSHFISKLHMYKRAFMAPSSDKDFKNYLFSKFTKSSEIVADPNSQLEGSTPAAVVDYEGSCVRIVKCDRSGMGKSLYIRHLAENLQQRLKRTEVAHVTIPLHGPVITPDTVLELFQEHLKKPSCYIYHVDIAPNILWKVDTILFSLLILQCVCDSQGRVWRCHPNQLYAVEVTLPNSQKDSVRQPERKTLNVLDLLPSVSCQSPKDVLKRLRDGKEADKSLVSMDSEEFKSNTYQRVYQYIRRFAAGSDLNAFSFGGTIEGSPKDCLEILLEYCGVVNPSWSEIRHFVKFLDLQLQSCEESVFTTPEFIKDVMAGLKGFVVKFMFNMSRDFSTATLRGEYAQENEEHQVEGALEVYEISERKRWEQNPHPYIFFNKDGVSITFVGFTVTKEGHLINPKNRRPIEKSIMRKSLYDGLKINGANFSDDYRKWRKSDMIKKISMVMGVEDPTDPDKSYVLTVDNVIKILAIQMRFRCGIPVVIMGETGCGKTRLIRYMCELAKTNHKKETNMIILKVHGGTSEDDICQFIKQAEKIAKENNKKNLDTVVFFDEANTTDAIGLVKEVMCDRRIYGKPVSDDLKFIAACNPYRMHKGKMIARLEKAGLGFFVKPTETQQKLGEIPLRQLVYRVLDLPPSMRPLVYDFGQLNMDTESDYIRQIIQDHIAMHSELSKKLTDHSPIANVLAWSQSYMRKREDECSFVSLRDVKRAMIVFEYLYDMMDTFGPLMDEWASGERRHVDNEEDDENDFKYSSPGPIARALILSLSVCYHARLEKREDYEEGVVQHFTGPIKLSNGVQQFRDEIRWCQEALLDSMHLDDNIARNAALRENVFMMVVCVELRIPLFLVGKPGSSKSLAKSIISESMRGKDSRTPLLKKFKEVGIFSYQCSQLSTSESVIEVFTTASKFQSRQDKNSYVAVVVLDEVGLAEDSPNLPLKALHPLLEDGTEGAKKDFTDQIIAQEERVAFIGISNWALDPAKMNRGVMVTRADPSEAELVLSARGICSMKDQDPIKAKLDEFFNSFAKSYISICGKQERQFFGLRDFYR